MVDMLAVKATNRFAVLATIMFALLALSLAGAAVLMHLKSGLGTGAALTDPQKIGSIEVRLPAGWAVSYSRSGRAEFITAIEPGPASRRLGIRATDIDPKTSAMDFFGNFKHEDVRMKEDINVPGGSGVILHPNEGPSIGAIVFEFGRAVTIELTRPSGSTSNDDAIILDVATSVRLNELPPHNNSGGDREI